MDKSNLLHFIMDNYLTRLSTVQMELSKSADPVDWQDNSTGTKDENNSCEYGHGYFQLRTGAKGKFFGCSNYPGCKNTRLDNNGVPGTNFQNESEMTNLKCPTCNSGKLIRRVAHSAKNEGRNFYGCSKYPKCEHFSWVE